MGLADAALVVSWLSIAAASSIKEYSIVVKEGWRMREVWHELPSSLLKNPRHGESVVI